LWFFVWVGVGAGAAFGAAGRARWLDIVWA
jgi:hypothetical protein